MSLLSSTSITSAIEIFKSEAVQLPKWFHSNFNRKLIGGNAILWILSNGLNIIAILYGRQYSNGLSEHTWCTLIQMGVNPMNTYPEYVRHPLLICHQLLIIVENKNFPHSYKMLINATSIMSLILSQT